MYGGSHKAKAPRRTKATRGYIDRDQAPGTGNKMIPMPSESLNEYLAMIGFEPTTAQRRFIEEMETLGRRMGSKLGSGIKDEINVVIQAGRRR